MDNNIIDIINCGYNHGSTYHIFRPPQSSPQPDTWNEAESTGIKRKFMKGFAF